MTEQEYRENALDWLQNHIIGHIRYLTGWVRMHDINLLDAANGILDNQDTTAAAKIKVRSTVYPKTKIGLPGIINY